MLDALFSCIDSDDVSGDGSGFPVENNISRQLPGRWRGGTNQFHRETPCPCDGIRSEEEEEEEEAAVFWPMYDVYINR